MANWPQEHGKTVVWKFVAILWFDTVATLVIISDVVSKDFYDVLHNLSLLIVLHLLTICLDEKEWEEHLPSCFPIAIASEMNEWMKSLKKKKIVRSTSEDL